MLNKSYIIVLLAFIANNSFSQQGVFQPGDYKDGIYDKENAVNRRFVPYTHLREADVTWEKRVWRELDMREKQNQPLFYPKTDLPGRVSFIQLIVRNVMSGRIVAFDDEEFLVTRDPSDLKSKLYSAADTVEAPDYDSAGNEIMVKTIKKADTTLYYENFCSLQLKEDWFFDKQKSSLEVRIVGLGLNFIPIGKEDIGCVNLFWIYFPACRPLFAKYEVFNTKNDSERRTFEDIFWKRQFASRLTKESNVYDRKISEYAKGIEALLESDKIKGDIFRLEHDLWQF
jgi:gliding motility associated protien GldN